MSILHEHEDFNGVDVSLHKEHGSFLLLIESDNWRETLSVWITKETLISFVNKLSETDDMEEPRQWDHDPVHRPQHYMQGHIETLDKIKLLLTPEEYLGYLKGNVIKYDRAPFKGNMEQDYDKQKVYYDWALEQEANQ